LYPKVSHGNITTFGEVIGKSRTVLLFLDSRGEGVLQHKLTSSTRWSCV